MNTTRLTVTLAAGRYTALKETAARQNKSMAEIIDESLELYGVKSKASALALLDKARQRAARLGEKEATSLAVNEVRSHRARR